MLGWPVNQKNVECGPDLFEGAVMVAAQRDWGTEHYILPSLAKFYKIIYKENSTVMCLFCLDLPSSRPNYEEPG